MSKSTLPQLDNSLYPQVWEQQRFNDGQTLLKAMLTGNITPNPQAFTKQLLANDVYQKWINFTVFGRYIQHNFTAFYQQSEDSFNVELPALFRHELMRHTQYLPLEQILFFAGNLPSNVRQEQLLTSTLNPATAVITAQQAHLKTNNSAIVTQPEIIINQIRVMGEQVLGFPLRHNKRTSERTRNEVLLLEFHDLRLVAEDIVKQESCFRVEMLKAAAPKVTFWGSLFNNDKGSREGSKNNGISSDKISLPSYCLRQYELK